MTDTTHPTSTSWDRWALVLACTATFMLMMDVTVINVALPVIRQELDADLATQQWILASYTLPLAAFLLLGGALGDQLGRRRIFVVGLVLFTLSSLAAGLAPGTEVLVIARGVQGVGAAILFAVSPALIAQEFSPEARGKAYGLFGAITGLSLALGPIVGGLLTTVDWRWIFLVNVPIGLVLLVAAVGRARDLPSEGPLRLDVAGMITSALALGAITYGIIRSETDGWAPTVWVPLIAGAALLLAFLLIERSGPGRMLDAELMSNRTFGGLLASTFLSNATSLAGLFLVVSYVQNVLGLSALEGGLVLLALTSTLFVTAAVVGGLIDRFPPGALLGTAIALIAVGLALFGIVDADSRWTALLPGLLVMGVGMGMFNPPRSVLTVSVVPPAKAGLASGVGETFQQVGVVFGIAVFGALFQSRVVDAASDRDLGHQVASGDIAAAGPALADSAREWFTSGFGFVAVACGAVCAVGALIAFATIRSTDLHVETPVGGEEVAA